MKRVESDEDYPEVLLGRQDVWGSHSLFCPLLIKPVALFLLPLPYLKECLWSHMYPNYLQAPPTYSSCPVLGSSLLRYLHYHEDLRSIYGFFVIRLKIGLQLAARCKSLYRFKLTVIPELMATINFPGVDDPTGTNGRIVRN